MLLSCQISSIHEMAQHSRGVARGEGGKCSPRAKDDKIFFTPFP